MNRTTLIALIQNLKSKGFTSPVEKLLAAILTFIDTEGEPLQQCEIVEILELGRKHCENTLHEFVEAQLIEIFGRRTHFYKPTGLLNSHQDSSKSHQDSPKSHQDSPQPPVSPRKRRKKPLVNHVNSCKLTKPTNQEDSNPENQKTQATSIPSPEPTPGINQDGILAGKAGSADVSLPKVETTSAPAAPLSPVAPETPLAVDYDTFVAQTRQGLPKPNVAPPVQPETATFFSIISDKNVRGSVFCTDDPTDSLYQMFSNMEGKIVPKPVFNLKIDSFQDIVDEADKLPKMIPASQAFAIYVRQLWCLLYHSGSPDACKTFDSTLHRAAYLFIMEPWEEIGYMTMFPETLIAAAQQHPKAKNICNSLIGIEKDIYLAAGYGWDETRLWGQMAWLAECKHFGKSNARRELFPSYFYKLGLMHKKADNLVLTAHAKTHGLTVDAMKRRLEEEKMSAQRTSAVQVRIDPAPAKPATDAMKFLDNLKKAKQNLSKEDWDATIDDVWIRFTPEKFQNEVWSSLPSELQEEMLALIPVHHCHRLGIGEAKKEMIRRLVKTA